MHMTWSEEAARTREKCVCGKQAGGIVGAVGGRGLILEDGQSVLVRLR